MAEIVMAPWTDDQVRSLNLYQRLGTMHPYTCPSHEWCLELVARRDGLVCPVPECTYEQDWAHEFAVNWGRSGGSEKG